MRRLLRYQWTERRLMVTLLSHLAAEPLWEVKCGYALHQWQDAEHVDWLRKRITEMRHPVPPLDAAPDPVLDTLLEEALRAESAEEMLAGPYLVIRAALAQAYRDHLSTSNPLVDHPTRRVLRRALLDHEDALTWATVALSALAAQDAGAKARASAWQAHLRKYLDAAGGIAGPSLAAEAPTRSATPFKPQLHPARDARFTGQYAFEFPPHVIYNDERIPAEERNLALLAKRTLEMDVPEMMASILLERADQPWEFHLDYSRQLWDECRHAMMGTVAFDAKGVDWTQLPLNVGFSLRLNLHATPLERQVMLYAIEQSLMPAETGKRYEFQTASAARDPLSAHFHDYDWADEVLHAHIGRRWLKKEGISTEQAFEQAKEIHEKTWAALQRYRRGEPAGDWWDDFVRRVLGHPSALPAADRRPLDIIAE